MQVSQTPQSIDQLDLMKRLDTYANGKATWSTDGSSVGPSLRQACRTLHAHLIQLVNEVLAPLLDRTTSREMETFTMHDRRHGLKVAHLMWHILIPARRDCLTPPEIAMLVLAAYMHDLGMALSTGERNARLELTSDLWEKLEVEESLKCAFEQLRTKITDPRTPELAKRRAERELHQAEEALLSQDTRERHATRERYEQLLSMLDDFHQKDPTRIPDVASYLSFEGDSFRQKLVDICVSHNEETEALVRRDETDFARPRFPADYPVGSCSADLHLIAAALRLGDVLDFDRERTPPVLFHYLLPASVGPEDSRSVLEWGKHLTISNWHIDPDAVVFRGRCHSHIIHHAVVNFCRVIQEEILATRATFMPLKEAGGWSFVLPATVKADIHSEGYRYVPYRFELDDERVYNLLMGGAIYPNPLFALRELIQNAVDACKLRDALTRLYEPHIDPSTKRRITVRYEEPNEKFSRPRIIVQDTGIGMDAWVIENWFLKVGRSYYQSSDFRQIRVALRRQGLDFAPVSEFGIGFLSCFLLADNVTIETAMWEPVKGDILKRTLQIEGPTRLIRLEEARNEGPRRFKGTRITLFLSQKNSTISWDHVISFLRDVCQGLPYRLHLEHVPSKGVITHGEIDPRPLRLDFPSHLDPFVLRMHVDNTEFGIEGEIAFLNPLRGRKAEQELLQGAQAKVLSDDLRGAGGVHPSTALLRGGFNIGVVPGLPHVYGVDNAVGARLRLTWNPRKNNRYILPNLARTSVADRDELGNTVLQIWLTHLIDNADQLQEGQLFRLHLPYSPRLTDCTWLQRYDALTLYNFVKPGWRVNLRSYTKDRFDGHFSVWEKSEGQPIWLGPDDALVTDILKLILPKVTHMEVGSDGEPLVRTPIRNWRQTLRNWHDYVTSPASWSRFAPYNRRIEDVLFYYSPTYKHMRLNSRYRDRFASFQEEDLVRLIDVFSSLLLFHDERINLGEAQANVLERARQIAGDLEIASFSAKLRLGSIKAAVIESL